MDRKCTKCASDKPSEAFYKLGIDRIDSWCKDCRKAARRNRYVPEKAVTGARNLQKFMGFFYHEERLKLNEVIEALDKILDKHR